MMDRCCTTAPFTPKPTHPASEHGMTTNPKPSSGPETVRVPMTNTTTPTRNDVNDSANATSKPGVRFLGLRTRTVPG